MKRDLPSAAGILEELADKVAVQIDHLAPVGFDSALKEMRAYHRFLLALNASRDPSGAPFSYAEVPGDAWTAPHRQWTRQYGRLFERAADRIPDDASFVRKLAHIPGSLLPGEGEPELSHGVVRGIVDLGPLLMHRLEAWKTKRTLIETKPGDAAAPRLALAGSDAKAYASVVTEFVGAWESTLQLGPIVYGWNRRGLSVEERWRALAATWPFLLQHLQDTAYSLAIAVWNEDEVGAELFQDALVRWPDTLSHDTRDAAELNYKRLAFPDLVTADWGTVVNRTVQLLHELAPQPTPDELFRSVLLGAHDDVMILTAALLLFWTINEKQVTDIGARTASALMRRQLADLRGEVRHQPVGRPFASTFLDLMRLELAGERYQRGSYGAELDSFVSTLDNMTERSVVPGRIFTPSTLHGRDELLTAVLAMLAAGTPQDADERLQHRIAEIAARPELLPDGDQSLRNMLHELGRYSTTLEQRLPQVQRGFELLSPQGEFARATEALASIVRGSVSTIEAERLRRLTDSPVDPEKIEQIRLAIEASLLAGPAHVPFFRHVPVDTVAGQEEGRQIEVTFNLGKAQLVEPMMESSANFAEFAATATRERASVHVWRAFCERPREVVAIASGVETEEYWQEVLKRAGQVGPQPLLVVSRRAEGRLIQNRLYRQAAIPNLRVEYERQDEPNASYIVTVEGIEVHGADFEPGRAWLFSARSLRAVRYSTLNVENQYVSLSYELGKNLSGTLRAKFQQNTLWTAMPVFELRGPDPDNGA